MKIIGLTGPSGAGKSTLCEKFEQMGIPCINTDEIYHEITSKPSPCLDELCEKFGSAIINESGTLNREALAKIVFEGESREKNLANLNATTHKYVWEETNRILTKYMESGKVAAVIDAPALFSSKIFIGACDFIISVLCDKEARVDRIMKRDGISRESALARINAQPSDEFFIENSDYYITNCGTKNEMNEKLLSIFEEEEIHI
ncbi:MAG: dephospho-CoA kinase [Clostridia bacterium]|nr:dephospho-CoA kinase [Clostridia bacterium]